MISNIELCFEYDRDYNEIIYEYSYIIATLQRMAQKKETLLYTG